MVILPTFGVKESNYQPSLSLSHTIALCGSESIKRPPSIAFLYVVSSSGNPQHWQRLSLSDSQLSVTTITSNAPKWNAFMRTKWAYQHEESEHSVLVCVREREQKEEVERDAVNGNKQRENLKHMALRFPEIFMCRREVVTGMWCDSYHMEWKHWSSASRADIGCSAVAYSKVLVITARWCTATA